MAEQSVLTLTFPVSIPCKSGQAVQQAQTALVKCAWNQKFQSPVNRGKPSNRNPMPYEQPDPLKFQSPVNRGKPSNKQILDATKRQYRYVSIPCKSGQAVQRDSSAQDAPMGRPCFNPL